VEDRRVVRVGTGRPACRDDSDGRVCAAEITHLVICGEVGRCYTACPRHAFRFLSSGEADVIVPLDSLAAVEWPRV
jgi:hypothetical protein